MNSPRFSSHPLFVAFALQVVLGYEWLSAGWEKIYQGQFVPNIGKTFLRFGEGNPHEWYTTTLLQIAKNQPTVFGMFVQWGELLAGVGLLIAVALYGLGKHSSSKNLARYIALVSLLGGAFMNLNFYFAAGWSSSSTGGLNVLMLWIQIILFIAWLTFPKNQEKAKDKMRQ